MPEVITYDKESKNYQSTAENVAELLPWVEKQVKKALEDLQEDVKKNFFEEKEGNVTYKMDLVKKYLESCIQKDDFSINSVVVMAVQIGLESLGEDKYDVGVIDGLLKSNSGKASDTEKAIMKFQEDNGLKVDGIPGKETIGMLLEKIEGVGNNGKSVFEVWKNKKKQMDLLQDLRGNNQTPNKGNVDLQDLRYDNLIKNKNGRHNPEEPQVSIDYGNEKEQDAEIIVQGAKTEEQVEQTPTADSEATTLPTEEAAIEAAIEAANDAEALRKQQIKDVQDKINALSGYTVGQESVIKNARDAYNDLAGDLKNSVTTTNLDNAEQQRVKYVEELINKIPQNITFNDGKISGEEAIKKTRDAYNKLDYLKNKISNELVSKLETAENKLNELRNQANEAEALRAQQIKNVQDKINKLSGYAVGKESEIKSVRDAYNNLDIDLRNGIDLSKLEKAENERVQYVEKLINNLPKPADITTNDEKRIKEARNAYENLFGDLYSKVSNLINLLDAENALLEVKSKEKARLEEESRRQIELEDNSNPNIVTNSEVSVNITPDYADSNHFELKNRNAYLNIDILQGPKLEATNIDEVGGIGSSMMEGFSNADYNTSQTEGSITYGYGKTIKNMRWGRGAGTRSINRFWKKGEKGVLDEEKLKKYCIDRGIKSFVLYFGGNEARSSQQAVDNAYNDIKLMCEYLSNIGVQPVLCTCIGENKIEHSVGGNGKIYLLPEFNNKIRELGRLNNWPVIDYAKIDIGNVWYPSSTSDHPIFSHGYPEMRQKILENLSQ